MSMDEIDVSMDEFEEIVWNKKMKYIDETDQIRSIFHALDSHGNLKM